MLYIPERNTDWYARVAGELTWLIKEGGGVALMASHAIFMTVKSKAEIYQGIIDRYEVNTKQRISEGSVLDFFALSVAGEQQTSHQEIEDNRDPHIFTRLSGSQLDANGFFLGVPRKTQEDDNTLLYRQMNWCVANKAANDTAIKDALLNLKYASNAEYIPFTKGCATASVYILPRTYDTETITKALSEVREIVKKVGSSGNYVEYIIPAVRFVTLLASVKFSGDIETAKKNITEKVKLYINNIKPGSSLLIDSINTIGIEEVGTSFFMIAGVMVGDTNVNALAIIQAIDTKLLFEKIIWIDQ